MFHYKSLAFRYLEKYNENITDVKGMIKFYQCFSLCCPLYEDFFQSKLHSISQTRNVLLKDYLNSEIFNSAERVNLRLEVIKSIAKDMQIIQAVTTHIQEEQGSLNILDIMQDRTDTEFAIGTIIKKMDY